MQLLSFLIFGPIIGAFIVYVAGFAGDKVSKGLTIIISAATVGLTLFILLGFNWSAPGFQLVESYDWAKDFGLTYVVGIDGISLPLLIISTLLTTLSAAGSWEQIQYESKRVQRAAATFRRRNHRRLHLT